MSPKNAQWFWDDDVRENQDLKRATGSFKRDAL